MADDSHLEFKGQIQVSSLNITNEGQIQVSSLNITNEFLDLKNTQTIYYIVLQAKALKS